MKCNTCHTEMEEHDSTEGVWKHKKFTCQKCGHMKEINVRLEGYQDIHGIPIHTVIDGY